MYYSLISSMSKISDAEKFIIAAGITDATQKLAINTLVNDLKSYGLWSKMKAIYPIIGGTASSHKFNLKDPRDLNAAFRLTFNGGWTHSSNGALPNGTNAYANTYLIPYSSLTLNNTHLSYYSRTSNIINGQSEFGIYISGGNPCYSMGTRTGIYISDSYNFSTNRISASITNASGLFISSRINNSDLKLYKNSNQIASSITINTTLLPNSNIYLAANNQTTEPINGYSTKQTAFASIGDGLTDTEASNFYTAVQTYQTTLGRQV